MRPIVQSMIARVSSTRRHIPAAVAHCRSSIASSANSYKNDDIKLCMRNRCTVMSCLMGDRLQTIQHGSAARLSSYTDRINIHARQFSSSAEQQQQADADDKDESKVAIDEIEDADLMAEVQEANER